jgi:hypothetical protein
LEAEEAALRRLAALLRRLAAVYGAALAGPDAVRACRAAYVW